MRRMIFTAAAVVAGAVSWVAVAATIPADASDARVRSDAATRQDLTHLSVAGSKAFDDVALARQAIFDGQPARAGQLIASAETAFDRARADRTVFVEAEDRLNPPASLRHPVAAGEGGTPTAWIPVAESFVLNETLAPPHDAAGPVEKANASLRANRRQDAFETLKVAHVSAVDTVALAPLDRSLAALHRADELMAGGDYYGASQALRALEDGIRYDALINTPPSPKT